MLSNYMFFNETYDFTLFFRMVISSIDMMDFFHQGVRVTTKCVLLLKMSLIILVYLLIIYYMPGTVLGI